MDDDNDSLHRYLPSQGSNSGSQSRRCLRGLKLRGLYTIAGVIVTPDGPLGPEGHLGARSSNRKEINRFEARATHQSTIHVGNGHQFGSVGGLYGASVENTDQIALAA